MFRKLIIPILLVLLVGLACNLGESGDDGKTPQLPTATKESVAEKPTEAKPTVKPTDVPAPTPSGAVTNLDDAEKAVIHILTEGSVWDPEQGEVINGATGSGFVIDPSGLAVTNNHVVTGAARLIVYFTDHEKAYNARVVGVSECSDLAIIDIEGEGFPYLEWYDGEINLGLEVYALGYPRGTTSFTRNKGEVSKRPFSISTSWASVDSAVEHSATINPGNSGGPLVNAEGKVVGINYSYNSADNRYYAITYSEALPVIAKLKNGENVASLGINGQAFVLENGASGIWVSSVASGSPADNAGLKGGDIITAMESIPLGTQGTMREYCDVVKSHSPYDTMSISVYRTTTGEFLEGQFNGRELAVVSTVSTQEPTPGGQSTTEAPPYFVEEFNEPPQNWVWYLERGSEDAFSLFTDNGKLHAEINDKHNYLYVFYTPYWYKNIRIDIEVKNVGPNNTNNVGMVCRSDEDYKRWYEVNINSNGYIYYYYYDNGGYELIHQGASASIKMGKASNQYTLICIDNKLKLWINGTEQKTVTDDRLSQGLVGIVVATVDIYPIAVDFEWVAVSEP